MGAYASGFAGDREQTLSSITHPSRADWITAHAVATDLAVVEVDRLWLRFQQLGCNEDGVLELEVLDRPPASNNIFAKQILSSFVGRHGDREVITFETFLNALKWAEMTQEIDKIKAIFNLIHNGQPITKDILYKVLKRAYPDDTEESVRKLRDTMLHEMDDKQQGFITQFQFVQWVKKLPEDKVTSLLEFHIVPPEITQEAHRLFSRRAEEQGLGSSVPSRYVLSDAILEKIANKVQNKDWHLLSNKLHFTGQELEMFQRKTPYSVKDQVWDMLKAWKQREGSTYANPAVLYRALQECDMHEAAQLLA